MESSIFDITVDILVERARDARAELVKRFKKTKPFRMEPMSDDERIQQYMTKIQPYEQELRAQGMDVDTIRTQMHELINRRAQNA